MSEIKIEKGVPFYAFSGYARYPFKVMEVGDSFFVPVNMRSRVVSASSWYGRHHNMKFSVRKTEQGFRCWRIA